MSAIIKICSKCHQGALITIIDHEQDWQELQFFESIDAYFCEKCHQLHLDINESPVSEKIECQVDGLAVYKKMLEIIFSKVQNSSQLIKLLNSTK